MRRKTTLLSSRGELTDGLVDALVFTQTHEETAVRDFIGLLQDLLHARPGRMAAHRQTDRHADKQTDTQTDRHADRQKRRQTGHKNTLGVVSEV